MAKTIKFNLICDGSPVRTIEDLREHFSVDDVLSYYESELLDRWLNVRGYHDELEKVRAINCNNPAEIIKELIKIFDITDRTDKLEEAAYIFEYHEERKELYSIYQEQSFKVNNILSDYRTGYIQLMDTILENPTDSAKIKAAIQDMVDNYEWILELDHRALFYKIQKVSPLAVMCLLMNPKTRSYYLPIESTTENGTKVFDTDTNGDKLEMYKLINSMISTARYNSKDFYDALRSDIKTFSGETDGYWKDIESKGKLYMIISMGEGDYVREAGKKDGDLSCDYIKRGGPDLNLLNGRHQTFPIIDGIDYKSSNARNVLKYMEV